MTYKELYERLQELRWLKDPFGVFIQWHLKFRFEPLLGQELDELHRQHFPRRKKIEHANLPPEEIAAARARWQEKALAYLKECAQEHAEIDEQLDRLAVAIELQPTENEQRVTESDYSTYRSQGMGMEKYTRQALGHSEQLLQQNGFSTRVVGSAQGYELWSDAEKWQLDALRRRQRDPLAWAVACWQRGVNPKVYSPFLPDEIFERSLELWREGQKAPGQTLPVPQTAPVQTQ